MKEGNMRTIATTWKACGVFAAATAFLIGGGAPPFLGAAVENAAIEGEMAKARVSVNGRSYEMSLNRKCCKELRAGERQSGRQVQVWIHAVRPKIRSMN